ncbi:pteridine reductase [Teredinibacter purpureus]|uniref:pteridine reductase n=1 Tax=Teredinibacter purpureus TaxID=2731756 RepID=UPI0005F7BFD2|nr:pteridine reductase [Teredinibacter purpureus]
MNNPAPVALVTGGARRIGAAIVQQLHTAGYTVVIHCDRSLPQAHALREQLNTVRANSAFVIQATLSGANTAQSIAHDLLLAVGRCDLLVNNASSFFPTPLESLDETDWDALFNSNAKAPLFLSHALRQPLKQANGCIINIADVHAHRPLKNHTIYCMAKAANLMLTQSLALEFAPHIRVNGIAPGAILWPEDSDGNLIENPARLNSIPLKTIGGCTVIADAVQFLAKHNNYITGQILNIDGGKTLQQ